MNFKLLVYFLLFGVLPSVLIYKVRVDYRSWKTEVFSKLKYMAVLVLVLLVTGLAFSRNYTSFFREHKILRYYTNPITWIYSTVRLSVGSLKAEAMTVRPIGRDAKVPASDTDRELIILVVGRSDTGGPVFAERVRHGDQSPSRQRGRHQLHRVLFERHIDGGFRPLHVLRFRKEGLQRTKGPGNRKPARCAAACGRKCVYGGTTTPPRKGLPPRVAYEDYQSPKINPVCDVECRDEGMLVGLQEYIDRTGRGDITIVLHQMGNHGPAYYKRYPRKFERFTPVCETKQLEECTNEQVENAYANAILYTDYFLSRVIALLKQNADKFETAMVYVGDHGESLGENRIYLHGLPYFMAPDSQKHVPAVLWFGDSFKIDRKGLKAKANLPFSHDNLFHTLLGLMEIETTVYNKSLDILNYDR